MARTAGSSLYATKCTRASSICLGPHAYRVRGHLFNKYQASGRHLLQHPTGSDTSATSMSETWSERLHKCR
ncbi:hypothetical protein MTO96_025177 [Rhipicephalus appendiculatus]